MSWIVLNGKCQSIKLVTFKNARSDHQFDYFQYTGSNMSQDFQLPICASTMSLNQFAVLFYMGQRLHTIAMSVSDSIYQTEWHRYSRSVRLVVLLMIMRSQRPYHLGAYGIMQLNLENYVRVSG